MQLGSLRCVALAGVLAALPTCVRTPETRSPTLPPAPPAAVSTTKPPEPVTRNATIGTAHPYTFQAAAPDGRWVVLCQAREDTDGDGMVDVQQGHHGAVWGDRMRMYLVRGSGPGEEIDGFLGADPSGVFLAILEAGKVQLLDSKANVRVELRSADARREPSAAMPPRQVRFDPAGGRLLYIRQTATGSEIVIRDLPTGHERTIDPGPGNLWRADFAPNSQWVSLWMVVRDTNGDGKLSWPEVRTTRDDDPCGAPASYSTYGVDDGSDQLEQRFVPIAGGTPRPVPDVVLAFGQKLLRRDGQGRLLSEGADGKAEVLVPAGCQGRIRHADPNRGLVVMACGTFAREREARRLEKRNGGGPFALRNFEPKPVPLELFTPKRHQVLGVEAEPRFVDEEIADTSRVAYFQGAKGQTHLLDVETGAVRTLPEQDRVLALHEARALVGRGDGALVLLDLVSNEEQVLVQKVDYSRRPHEQGELVFVPPYVVDMRAARITGLVETSCNEDDCDYYQRCGLALSNQGSLLVAAPPDPKRLPKVELMRRMMLGAEERSEEPVPLGPLIWLRPKPP